MARVIFAMTMSLDGFVNDELGSVAELYPDLDSLRDSEVQRRTIGNTGAVVMGWNAFAMAKDRDWYAENYEYQLPIFVVTRQEPLGKPKENRKLAFTFVTNGVENAILRARDAAGGKNVRVVGGARTLQRCIRGGLVDELHIDVMPVLLCRGLRLFEHLGAVVVQLSKTNVTEAPGGRTHLEFRVLGRRGE
jgi:dihydrofolate reductase